MLKALAEGPWLGKGTARWQGQRQLSRFAKEDFEEE